MHYFSVCTLLITLLIVINARSPPLSTPPINNYRSCPEQYLELRRRQAEANTELDDDDDNGIDETRESVCEQAMDMIIKYNNFAKLNPSIFLTYCPHYDERLALARENNNNTLCEIKKQELDIKQKRQEVKRKRYDDSSDTDDDKRRALHRRELKKRFALRFIRKRMS